MEENSTAHQNTSSSIKAMPDAFFAPAWQLALTVEFYFRYAVLAIGLVGTAANALVIYALIAHHARETKKRVINLLIINQNFLDLVCCLLLVITVCVEINNTYLTGAFGYFICSLFMSYAATYSILSGSIINLVALTLERYLKVVHPFWSKKHLKRWMIHAVMAFAWIAGIALNAPVSFVVSRVEDGFCLFPFEFQFIYYELCIVVVFFFIPVFTFVYCYWRIVVVLRRQMRVMAAHNVEGSSQMNASQAQSKRVKWNVIKTMIIVSVVFVVCYCPNNVLFLILVRAPPTSSLVVGYYPTVFLMYLNVCMNPFIYATKHDGVKQQLARLIVCRKPRDVLDVPGSSSNRAGGTQQTRPGVAHK